MMKQMRVLSPIQERRQFPRYYIHPEKRANLVAHLLAVERLPAHVVDLSKVGIRLFCDHRLKPGEVVVLSLHHIPRRFVCEVPVRIALAEEFEGAFLLRAAFTRELTDKEMAGLL
jgi:hypothetical protein